MPFVHIPKITNPLLLTNLITLCGISSVSCSPPSDTITCSQRHSKTNCTITNSYGAFPDRSTCKVAQTAYPTTEDELSEAVAGAAKKGQKMKVATRYSHSIPNLVCPDGEVGLLISTKYLNRTVSVDPAAQTVTVESGVTLQQLIKDAAMAGLALPYAPYWWGLTVGGMIGTGAHGSSLWGKGSGVHDYVVQLRIASRATSQDGYFKVRVLNRGDMLKSAGSDGAKILEEGRERAHMRET